MKRDLTGAHWEKPKRFQYDPCRIFILILICRNEIRLGKGAFQVLEEETELSDDELAHWLAFSVLPGIGPKRFAALYERLGSAETLWKASRLVLERIQGIGEETIQALEKGRREIEPYRLLEQLRKSKMDAWPWIHPLYPIKLRHIDDPPLVLFVNGILELQDFNHTVAVVGTRQPTLYGQRIAKETAYGLAVNGVTVVSGMALGIDSIAHWGAIEGGAPTIAVLGCGADVCYPSSNQRLFEEIIAGRGAVVSEYFPGTTPEKYRFPARNRIIAGLSSALVVVEGGLESGSLISARMAFDQSREVFAFPGRIDSDQSKGPHKLIRELNAHLCTSYRDIIDDMNWAKTKLQGTKEKAAIIQLYGREKEIYELISSERVHFDTLCQKSGMPVGELSATLTMLELGGLVSRDAGDWYERNN